MLKKRSVVQTTEELHSLLTNMEVSEGDVLLQSDQYFQLGCDLRDLGSLNRILSTAIDLDKCKFALCLLTRQKVQTLVCASQMPILAEG